MAAAVAAAHNTQTRVSSSVSSAGSSGPSDLADGPGICAAKTHIADKRRGFHHVGPPLPPFSTLLPTFGSMQVGPLAVSPNKMPHLMVIDTTRTWLVATETGCFSYTQILTVIEKVLWIS